MTTAAASARLSRMDFFDLHDLAARAVPGITRQEAAPARRGPRPPPICFTGPAPRDFGAWYFADREAPAASLFTVEDVTLSGDRVLSRGDAAFYLPQNGIHAGITTGLNASLPVRRVPDTRVLLCGPAYRMYGHWLVDFCPRLHVLTALGHDLRNLRYLLPADLMPFSLEWLTLLGITPDQIDLYNPAAERIELATALVPTTLRGNGRASPLFAGAMHDFKHRIIGDAAAPAQRNIFVSRRHWKNRSRRLANIEAVERVFESRGFEFVFPEQLGVAAQIALFSTAQIIAGEYGSALHNAIFAPAGAVSLALRGTEGHPGFLHSGLCEVLKQDCAYVFGKTDILLGNQIYAIEPDDIQLCLDLLSA
jgi:capsular polysaccharide biosynthesis protein